MMLGCYVLLYNNPTLPRQRSINLIANFGLLEDLRRALLGCDVELGPRQFLVTASRPIEAHCLHPHGSASCLAGE
jgi:hypothetical protein